jgi:hypothetical protein
VDTAPVNEAGEISVADFYTPLPKQQILHTSPAKNLLAVGGGGSGKSMFLLGEAIYTSLQYPGANTLLLRRDFPELEKGLILDFRETVPKQLYLWNDSKHIATWFNGAKTFFGHLQNGSEKTLSQYLSSAFVFIGIDEMGQFSYNAWDFLSFRNRVNKGCSADIEGHLPLPRMAGSTNPLGPGYQWIKSMWVDHKPVSQLSLAELPEKDGKYYAVIQGKKEVVYDPHDYVYVHSTILDNPIQIAKDPGYIAKLQRLAPALRKKALEGDLNSVSGAYFGNFSAERNIVMAHEVAHRIKWEPWQPRWIGIDWGLAHNATVFWYTRAKVKDIAGQWKSCVVCYRELVVNETAYLDLCQMIFEAMITPQEREQRDQDEIEGRLLVPPKEVGMTRFIFLSPERFARQGDPDNQHTIGAEMGEKLHRLGLPYCSRANNRRADGAVFMYNLIETGELILLDCCPNAIRSLQTVVRDEADLEDVKKQDGVDDDCYDGQRYGLVSMLKERNKPQDIKDQERIAAVEDPQARMMLAYQIKLQTDKRKSKGHGVKPIIAPKWMIP